MKTHTVMKLVIATAVVLGALLLVFAALFWTNHTSSQRRAIAGLNDIGATAMQRTGMTHCMPSFAFDKRGPQLVEEVTGPAYFGTVTDVWFREYDEQQLVASIPYLQQFSDLKRVGFDSKPKQRTVVRMREVLPNVTFVDSAGVQFP